MWVHRRLESIKEYNTIVNKMQQNEYTNEYTIDIYCTPVTIATNTDSLQCLSIECPQLEGVGQRLKNISHKKTIAYALANASNRSWSL